MASQQLYNTGYCHDEGKANCVVNGELCIDENEPTYISGKCINIYSFDN